MITADGYKTEDIIKNMTPADIQDFVNRMFDNPDNLDVVFTPKK